MSQGNNGYKFAKWKKDKAKEFRENLTPPEKVLWDHIKGNKIGYFFTKQVILRGYIVDFFCKKYNFIIEVDSSYHDPEKDKKRDEHLAAAGYYTYRVEARDIFKKPGAVVNNIAQKLIERRRTLKGKPSKKIEVLKISSDTLKKLGL